MATSTTSSDTSAATTCPSAAGQGPARRGGFGDFEPGEISCWFPHFGHGGREVGAYGGGKGGAYVLGSAPDEPEKGAIGFARGGGGGSVLGEVFVDVVVVIAAGAGVAAFALVSAA